MIKKYREIEPINFDQLKIVDFTANENVKSSLAEITVPVGVSHKSSWSKRSDKYYYIIQGELEFTIENEKCKLTSGDFCIIQKMKRFKYRNIGKYEAKLILVHTPSFLLECEEFE